MSSSRRDFLGNLARVGAGCAAFGSLGKALEAQVAPPKSVRVGTGLAKPLIEMSDLAWQGMAKMPATGWSYGDGALAVRYVNGQRRLLSVKYSNNYGPTSSSWPASTSVWLGYVTANRGLLYYCTVAGKTASSGGPTGTGRDIIDGSAHWAYCGPCCYQRHTALCEFTLPATLTSSVETAQNATDIRQWFDWTWYPTGNVLAGLANSWFVGGIWWDEAQGVVWYTMYPYYAPSLCMPVLGATALHDDGTVTKYGPWYYISDAAQDFRKIAYYFVPIPASAQAALGGRTMALGADSMGAAGGSPTNWGPGLTAIHLPALKSTAFLEKGIPLMDYSPNAGGLTGAYYHCWREADYDHVNQPAGTPGSAGAAPRPVGDTGFWQASADAVGAVGWVETATRQGLVIIGRRTSHATWYGLDSAMDHYWPDGHTTIDDYLPGTYNGIYVNPDTVVLSQGSTGYHSDRWQSALWRFDPAQINEVALGKRKASADGMRPALIGHWSDAWPGIPKPIHAAYVVSAHGAGVVDTKANQFVWMLARSNVVGSSVMPTVQVFALPA